MDPCPPRAMIWQASVMGDHDPPCTGCRAISKEGSLDIAVEIVSFTVGLAVLLLSIACAADGCLGPSMEVGKTYSMLMFATCAILFCRRRLWPREHLAGTKILMGCLRLLFTGALALSAIFLQAKSLKGSIWLQTAHQYFAGFCGVYILLLLSLPYLYYVIRRRVNGLHSQLEEYEQYRTCPPQYVTRPPLFATQGSHPSHLAVIELTSDMSEEPTHPTFRVCTICYDNPANAMCLPCRHASTCERCLLEVVSRPNAKCPVCRAVIQSYDVTGGDSGYTQTFVAPLSHRADSGPKMLRALTNNLALRNLLAFCCPALGPNARLASLATIH